MARFGRARRRAPTCSPDPRAGSALYANRRKTRRACTPGRPRMKKKKGMHKPLENISENAELGIVLSGCAREKTEHVTLDTEQDNECENRSDVCFHDILNKDLVSATSIKRSDTSSGSSLPSDVSAFLTDYDDSVLDSDCSPSQTPLTTLSSPETLRTSDFSAAQLRFNSVLYNEYCTAKKNSTLLDTSNARDIDSIPDLEEVSNILSLPKIDQTKAGKSTKTMQSKDPSVSQHLSTTVSGKNVYKISRRDQAKSCSAFAAGPGKLQIEHNLLMPHKQGLLLASTPFTYSKDLVIELSPIHPLGNDVELQPNSSGVFVHSSQIAPCTTGTLSDLKDTQKQIVQSPVSISCKDKILQPHLSGHSKDTNSIVFDRKLGGFKDAKKQLEPKRKDICCIITAPLCRNHSGMRRVEFNKYKLPEDNVEKDFLLD